MYASPLPLPREEVLIPMSEGLSLEGAVKIGEEVSEQYAVRPARFYVIRIIRPKYKLANKKFVYKGLTACIILIISTIPFSTFERKAVKQLNYVQKKGFPLYDARI